MKRLLDKTWAKLTSFFLTLLFGTMTVLACQSCRSQTVILTGSMTTLDQAEPNFAAFEKLYGIHYVIPESATFATAIGAGLCSLRQKSVK